MTVWELLEIEVSSQNPYIPAYEVETSSRYNQVFFFLLWEEPNLQIQFLWFILKIMLLS